MIGRRGRVRARATRRAGDALWVVGALSGTSADGVSACLARISGEGASTRARVACFRSAAFPAALRARIHRAAAGGLDGPDLLAEVVALDTLLGERFARAILALLDDAGRGADLVGLHGQTLLHAPPRPPAAARAAAGTLQIGNAAVVAERTGLPVVSDFRRRDMAVGGEGAPLVAILDHALYAAPGCRRALLNIGGIANVTLLPGAGGPARVRAFDTGPGNMLLDRAVGEATRGRLAYDRGGRLALAGRPSRALLARLLRHPFLARPAPKSADRGDFEGAWWERARRAARRERLPLPDLLATLAAFTAECAARAVARAFDGAPPHELLVSGGGARNRALLAALAARLPATRVAPLPDAGEAKEALLFAFLAREHVLGRPGNVPSATGARRPVVLGAFTPAPLARRRRPADNRRSRATRERPARRAR
jgi:anhydro-N-acetylmuramic acid kinase